MPISLRRVYCYRRLWVQSLKLVINHINNKGLGDDMYACQAKNANYGDEGSRLECATAHPFYSFKCQRYNFSLRQLQIFIPKWHSKFK